MARKKRGGRAYATDLTDGQWALIAPLLPEAEPGGRPRKAPTLKVVPPGALFFSANFNVYTDPYRAGSTCGSASLGSPVDVTTATFWDSRVIIAGSRGGFGTSVAMGIISAPAGLIAALDGLAALVVLDGMAVLIGFTGFFPMVITVLQCS